MKISIVTISYNSESHIEFALKSVIEQDYENIEHIIIDGGSNDRTLEIVNRYTKKHKHIRIISERDEGIYDALNKGINNSNGDIIGFVHSDDFLAYGEVISDLVLKFKKENLDGVYADLQYVNRSDSDIVIRKWKSGLFNESMLKRGWMPPHPTLFLNKKVYIKHGLYNLNYSISADYDYILRIFKDKKLKFGYIPKVITKMRSGGISNRDIVSIIKKSKEDYIAIRENNIGDVFTLINKNLSKIKQFFI